MLTVAEICMSEASLNTNLTIMYYTKQLLFTYSKQQRRVKRKDSLEALQSGVITSFSLECRKLPPVMVRHNLWIMAVHPWEQTPNFYPYFETKNQWRKERYDYANVKGWKFSINFTESILCIQPHIYKIVWISLLYLLRSKLSDNTKTAFEGWIRKKVFNFQLMGSDKIHFDCPIYPDSLISFSKCIAANSERSEAGDWKLLWTCC